MFKCRLKKVIKDTLRFFIIYVLFLVQVTFRFADYICDKLVCYIQKNTIFVSYIFKRI